MEIVIRDFLIKIAEKGKGNIYTKMGIFMMVGGKMISEKAMESFLLRILVILKGNLEIMKNTKDKWTILVKEFMMVIGKII